MVNDNFFNSLNNRKSLHFAHKNIEIDDITIKHVPVVENDSKLDDIVTIQTLMNIYKLIEHSNGEKILNYKDIKS